MKKICILFLALIIVQQACAFEDVVLPQSGYNASIGAQINSLIPNEEFCEIEKKVFKKTYQNDNAKNRLARLEKEIFGMEQSGENYLERFEILLTAAEYYQDGYRLSDNKKNENSFQRVDNGNLNSKNYIQNYNFDDDYDNSDYRVPQSDYISPKIAQKNQTQYYDDYDIDEEKNGKKKSKIKQFFSDLADILTAGVVTGYTLPMNGYDYGLDSFGTYTDFAGSNFVGPPTTTYIGPSRYSNYPSYVRVPNMIRPPGYHRNPYSHGYHRPRYSPHYPNSGYYRPNGIGVRNYGMGAKVRVIR